MIQKEVVIARLIHDGAQNCLPGVYLFDDEWTPGERVRITIERIEKKKLVDRTVAKVRKTSRKVRIS